MSLHIVNDQLINQKLECYKFQDKGQIEEILNKARELRGLNLDDVVPLLFLDDHVLKEKLFETASFVKNEIYGKRLVLFVPLYISNLCKNECLYCAFRQKNSGLKRKALNQEEIKEETKIIIGEGHKRVLMVAGEDYQKFGLDYVLNSIDSIYSVNHPKFGKIRRINVNIAPLSVDEFKRLHQTNIGTYQIFQETYHRESYKKLHLKGPKADYDYRLTVMDRAYQGGFEDVGIGALFGLYDYRFEVLAMLSHILHLEKNFGIGPHTISIPRMEPAHNSDVSFNPPYTVSDDDFKKIISILRIAVPYTGLILSTRENAQMRRDSFRLGISQISAGSKTNPGGYGDATSSLHNDVGAESQFSLGDDRPLHEVIEDIVDHGYIPSFCTGCYRVGRVGADFMDLAKPGLIKSHCLPNGMFTFKEYLEDFANKNLKRKGMNLIQKMISEDIEKESLKETIKKNLKEIESGKRDLYF